MQPVKVLPPGYYEHASIDLSRNRRAAVWLNVAGIPSILGWGWLFFRLAQWLNPQLMAEMASGMVVSAGRFWGWITAVIGVIILHELVHGLFLWLLTGERPVFGFSWYYAYAGAPDWYLPRWPCIVVALAPLVVISLVGVLLLPFLPPAAALALLLALVTNAGGAIGDIFVTVWVLRQPPTVLMRDTGPAFTLYRQGPSNRS